MKKGRGTDAEVWADEIPSRPTRGGCRPIWPRGQSIEPHRIILRAWNLIELALIIFKTSLGPITPFFPFNFSCLERKCLLYPVILCSVSRYLVLWFTGEGNFTKGWIISLGSHPYWSIWFRWWSLGLWIDDSLDLEWMLGWWRPLEMLGNGWT